MVYATLAVAVYRALLVLWARRPDPLTTGVVLVVATAVMGFASYRIGTARIRFALDVVELLRAEAPHLYRRLDHLAERVGVETPRLLIASLSGPNALALGGGVARAVALARGRNPVAIRRTIHTADAAVSSLVVVCLFVLTALVCAYSRRREYAADDRDAQVAGPLAMARTLEKIDRATTPGGLLTDRCTCFPVGRRRVSATHRD